MWKMMEIIMWIIALAIIAYVDVRTRRVYLGILIIPTLYSLVLSAFGVEGFFIRVVTCIVIFVMFRLVSLVSKGGMGAGDAYVLAALSTSLGFMSAVEVILLSFSGAALYGALRLVGTRARGNISFPFVPFIFFSYLGVVICKLIVIEEAALQLRPL